MSVLPRSTAPRTPCSRPDTPGRLRRAHQQSPAVPAAPGEAELSLVPAPGTPRLVISGELDGATSARLSALLVVLEAADRGVLLDLGAVTFTDSAGLTPVLDSSWRRREAHLPPLVLTGVSRSVRRMLDLLAEDPGVQALLEPSAV